MKSEPVELTSDDKLRMRRLQEEIAGRYVEMAMIMERVLGAEGLRSRATQPGAKMVMAMKPGGTTEDRDAELAPYICIEVDGGAWEDPPGWCRKGGCF